MHYNELMIYYDEDAILKWLNEKGWNEPLNPSGAEKGKGRATCNIARTELHTEATSIGTQTSHGKYVTTQAATNHVAKGPPRGTERE